MDTDAWETNWITNNEKKEILKKINNLKYSIQRHYKHDLVRVKIYGSYHQIENLGIFNIEYFKN